MTSPSALVFAYDFIKNFAQLTRGRRRHLRGLAAQPARY